MITESQKRFIFDVGFNEIGKIYSVGYKCQNLIRDIYNRVGILVDFNFSSKLSFEDIQKEEAHYHFVFLHRKETKVLKKITHIGIIFPNKKILHYSRYMNEKRIYQVHLSTFEEVFKIYDFVEF